MSRSKIRRTVNIKRICQHASVLAVILLAIYAISESTFSITEDDADEIQEPILHPQYTGINRSLVPFVTGVKDKIPRYKNQFPFTMQPNPNCRAALNDTFLELLGYAALADWITTKDQPQKAHDNHLSMSLEMERAEQEWRAVMDACHGPLPPNDDTNAFTLRTFWKDLARCGHPEVQRGGHPSLFGGEYCMGGWRQRAQMAFQEGRMQWESHPSIHRDPLVEAFIYPARCALKMQFPVVGGGITTSNAAAKNNSSTTQPPLLTNRQKRPGWKPQRVILLSATVGPKGATMGCKLVSTAYFRGWEVVLIEGPWRFIRHKYTDAMEALQLAISHSTIAAEDTLVVYADSMDVLVQQSPDYVVEAFLNMTTDFSFSAESGCFLMASWPHSLGIPFEICDGMYPSPQSKYNTNEKYRYANTGGWIGLASSAFVVLEEISLVVQNEGQDTGCHDHGTDQLLGNVAFLRHPTLVGLDFEYRVIATDAWSLLEQKLDLVPLTLRGGGPPGNADKAYCNSELSTDGSCPAFLHFNGRGSEGGKLSEAFEVLTSGCALQQCKPGKLFIAQIAEGLIWTEDFASNPRWKGCRETKHRATKHTCLMAERECAKQR